MARCPDCNKFVSYDDSTDPEIEIDIDGGLISATAAITLTCAECGTELRTTTLEFEEDVSDQFEAHFRTTFPDDAHPDERVIEASIEENGSTGITTRTEGKGRGLKTFYGTTIEYVITCECEQCKKAAPGKAFRIEGTLSDDCQASSMDEC